MTVWDVFTYLLIGNGSGPIPKSVYPGNRRTLRYLSRRRTAFPLLFFPLSWMILSAIQLPSGQWIQGIGGSSPLPFPSIPDVVNLSVNFAVDAHHRVRSIDEMVVLDMGTLMQYNSLKFTYLVDRVDDLLNYKMEQPTAITPYFVDQDVCNLDLDDFFDTCSDTDFVDDCQMITDPVTLQTFMDAKDHIIDDDWDPFEFHRLQPHQVCIDSVFETSDEHLLRFKGSDTQQPYHRMQWTITCTGTDDGRITRRICFSYLW
jgi:hypothetical protein